MPESPLDVYRREFMPKEAPHTNPSDGEKFDALGREVEEKLGEAHRMVRQVREIINIGDAASHEVPKALRSVRQEVQGTLEHIGEMEKLLPQPPETSI